MVDIFDSVCQHGDWTASVAPNFRKASTELNPSSEAQGHRKTVKWGSHRTNSFASGRKVKRTGRRKINLINANITYRISFVCDNFVHVYDTTQSHSSSSFCCTSCFKSPSHFHVLAFAVWPMGLTSNGMDVGLSTGTWVTHQGLHHKTMNSSPQATCDCH